MQLMHVRKACLSKVANPVSSSLGVSGVGSVAAVVGTATVGCGDGVAAQRLFGAAVLEAASLKQLMHALVVLCEMAPNACCKPVARLAIDSSPTAPQPHLSDILRFSELYVKTGQSRLRNRKKRYPLIAESGTASVARLAVLLGEYMARTQCSMLVGPPRVRGPLSAG